MQTHPVPTVYKQINIHWVIVGGEWLLATLASEFHEIYSG